METLLDYYGRKDLVPQFRQLLEQSKRKHWWEGLPKGVIPPLFDFYLGLEEGAVSIECYDALTVTGTDAGHRQPRSPTVSSNQRRYRPGRRG